MQFLNSSRQGTYLDDLDEVSDLEHLSDWKYSSKGEFKMVDFNRKTCKYLSKI